ncbi:U5 small nuclear ribonucleoprotein 40 kDa protein [Phoenix dactylifera]|uniref:U5 small nuclear ribonucleoprotein 40 kDa protein n=1 Tax=Phoenix dactylifera TaxID=42345 RepID=A0A8B7CKT4_PHODC|nr:U5 small nuclear ribonucleoprotein 40 kDa protein [Phoenix dactylifera]
MDPHLLKKPKLEEPSDVNGDESGRGRGYGGAGGGGDNEPDALQEQEEALVALIEHRSKEYEHLKQKVAYFKSQLDEVEKKLNDSKAKLARLRARAPSRTATSDETRPGRTESRSSSPGSRPQLVIPSASTKFRSQAVNNAKSKVLDGMSNRGTSSSAQSSNVNKSRQESSSRAVSEKSSVQEKRAKRKIAQKEHQDLIPVIRTYSLPNQIRFQPGSVISSQHKRKLRSLEVCPVNDQLFVTSALDGVVNLWQVQVKGPSALLLSTTDCVSPKQRRWPEDVAWHPDGDSLFAAYSADGGDSQISVLNLNASQKRVTFLEAKPHTKGIINSILFMPWADLFFATGGSDHAVILWHENDDSWKPKTIHGNLHSSAVMGVAGLQHKKIILSAGADKRIIAYDVLAGRSEFKNQIESKCMSILPNPSDFNLYLVQTGAPGRQLRLFDVRLRQTEIHAFGWKQETSESQSALINQAWSPDGLFLSSGSADPVIHIFDIRYDGRTPSQSVQAHQKRVFKAVWHQSLPLLTSISSDLNIGLHKIV